jgi:subtilisin family serine protease
MFSLTATKSFAFRIMLVIGVVFATVLATTPAQAYVAVARGTYIVQVKDGSAATVRALISRLGETPHDELTEVMDGFILDLTDSEVVALRADSNVLQVVADQPMSLLDTQSPTPSWGLDRIDQTNTTYDNAYNYPANAGSGVRVYVVDTGVVATDPDFAGRMADGFDAFGQNLSGTDCNGHGTHVAGTVAGTRFGVAKKATIVPVRVLGCNGSGSWSGFISAMDWIIANHPAGTPGVMNASLGGGKYQIVNDAVQKLFAAGITPVVAAGNESTDSCSRTPASTPNAITVGASTITDSRASFSNFGDCVDVFAPGSNIVSNSHLDSSTPRTLSGTSMASPHVAGLAALYLGANRAASPSDVAVAIQAGAQAGIVVDAKSLNGNYLINTRFTNASLPPVGAPTALVASNIASTTATVSWTAPAGTQAANSYKVEYREAAATAFTSVDSATTSVNLTSLKGNTTYSVRVSSVSGTTTSPASNELVFTTLGTVADAPTNLRSTAVFGSQVSMAWDAPLNGNGSRITGYEVWIQIAGNWTRQLTTSTTVAKISSLTANTAYSFRVLAVNAVGVSEPSNVLSVTTTAATPTVVVMTTRSNLTATGITVNWNQVAAIDSSAPITYRVVVSNTSNNAIVSTSTVATNSITLSGLTRYTTYSMVVTALSGTIAGPPSNPYTFRTLASVPTAPTPVYTQKFSDTQFNIRWQSPRDTGGVPLTGFKVEQLVSGAWVAVASPLANVFNYLVAAPAPGVIEQYRVSAVNSIGASAAVNVNVVGTAMSPQPPTGLVLTPVAATNYGSLTWLPPTNNGGAAITGYSVRRSTNNGTSYTTLISNLKTTSYLVALPAKGMTYTYTVVASNSGGTSINATPVSYTSQTSVPGAPAMPSTSFTTDGLLTVIWRAPVDNGGSAITAYKLQRLINGQFSTIREGIALEAKLTREAPGTSYSLRVIAVNALGEGAASSVAVTSVPFAKSTAPRNLTADSTSQNNRVVFRWQAPENTGGAAVSYYRLEYSANGTSWFSWIIRSGLTATVSSPPKGTTYTYRVVAYTQAGLSAPSNSVTVSVAASKPSSPSPRSATFASDGSILLTWYAPTDSGGSPVTGYRVESSTNGASYADLTTTAANVLSAIAPRANPGQVVSFRIYAITALGESNASSVRSIQMPFLKPTAPLNFTAIDTGTSVTVSWAVPENLGGATSASYRVQFSRDGGTTWLTSTTTSALSTRVIRPTKGTTWQYRVAANTAFGLGEFSNVVPITVSASAPSVPNWSRVAFAADGSIDLRFNTPSDNGGSPITGYTVQKSVDQVNWTTIATPAFGTNVLNIPRENPGVRLYLRVTAANALGTSVASVASIQMPFLKASAVQNFAVEDKQSYVRATWSAAANLGGSTYVVYRIEVSRDGATTWSQMTTVSGSSTSANLTRPTKGTTWQYRVTTFTSFGAGEATAAIAITAPATVPSSPSIRSFTMNPDQTMSLTFNGPSDLGGSALTGYIVERSSNASTWTVMSSLTAVGGPVVIEKQAPGTLVYVRVLAVNAIGSSAPSSWRSLQTPFVQASAVQNLTATPGSFVALRWQAPSDLGGSTSVRYYRLESSADGVKWSNFANVSGLSWNVSNPAKGTTMNYRVTALTGFGLGLSSVVAATAPTTAPSSVTSLFTTRNSATLFTVNFNRPSDLGGLAEWTYRIERQQGNAYSAVASAAGAASNSVQLEAPARNAYGYYRVIATNAKGDSVAFNFWVRG